MRSKSDVFVRSIFSSEKERFFDYCWSKAELEIDAGIDEKLVEKYAAKCRAFLVSKKKNEKKET